MAAITNIDDDHLDHYGSKEKIVEAFIEFVNKLPFYGRAALNANDIPSLQIKSQFKRPTVWYGIETEADYVAKNIEMSASGTNFDFYFENKFISKISTHLLGKHNVSNTLAAMTMSHATGIDWETIQKGLLKFQGVGRRLEKLYEKNHFVVMDDYGHHPTEVRATISTLKQVDNRKLCVVFEPHRYTRTQNFWNEFQDAFKGADEIFISPIYAASETPIEGITSEKLVRDMEKKGHNVSYLSDLGGMKELLIKYRNDSTIFLTLGAGAISKKIREIVKSI
jgi:UDP-N-acetylmuramate--alanine ligase